MNYKVLIVMTAAACISSFTTACGTEEKSNSVLESSINTTENSVPNLSKKLTGTVPKIVATVPIKKYSHSNKVFKLKDCTTSIFMENGWEILSGGMATEQQTDEITSFPAVVQYLDTKTTLTITVVGTCEEKEAFLAGTEETYISTYGSAYDSIEITAFRQLSIDEFDSFEIKADVVIKGESFTMTHILTNDVSGKSYSWMLLDNDGSFVDFDLVEAICYPKIVDTSKLKRFDKEDLDSYHKVHRQN